MAFQLSDTVNKDKLFLVKRSELEGRLDTVFYKPVYRENEKNIRENVYGFDSVSHIANRIADGPFGSDLKAEEYQPSGIPLLRVSNLKTGEIEGDIVFISQKKHNQLKRSTVYPNDVVLTKAGAILGYSAVFPEELGEGNITSHLVTITCRNDVNPQYLSCFFRSNVGQLQIYRWGNKSTRPELNTGEVEKILVPLPPAEIQAQIVAKMNAAYSAKKQKEAQAQHLLDSIDSYLLHELGIDLPAEEENNISQRMFVRKFSEVSGGRFDPFFHIPYLVELDTLFKSKSLNSLRYYANSYASGATPSKDESEIHYTTSDKGIPFIRVQNLSVTGELQLTDLVYISHETHNGMLNRSKVFEGDLLVKITGVGRMAVASVAPEGFEGNINQHVVVIRTGSKEVSRWLATFINLNSVEKIASKRATGGTRPALDYPALFSLPIIFPPLKKQNEIATHIQTIRDQAKQLRAEAAAGLEQAKQEVEAMILGKDSNQ